MNEFLDPERGRMMAVAVADGCSGCFYHEHELECPHVYKGRSYCSPASRSDGRSIIWVCAEDAPQNPKGVRMTDEQVAVLIARTWGSVETAPQSAESFARAIESAVLALNGIEK